MFVDLSKPPFCLLVLQAHKPGGKFHDKKRADEEHEKPSGHSEQHNAAKHGEETDKDKDKGDIAKVGFTSCGGEPLLIRAWCGFQDEKTAELNSKSSHDLTEKHGEQGDKQIHPPNSQAAHEESTSKTTTHAPSKLDGLTVPSGYIE